MEHDITWDVLRGASRSTLAPFTLTLENETLHCLQFLRLLPGKRLVALAKWKEQTVIAKLFYDPRRAVRHVTREVQGMKAVKASGVLSPNLLFQGQASDPRIHVLLMEYLTGESLETLWQAKTSLKAIAPVMQAVIIELATMHVLGVMQQDLHFKNFIVKKRKIFSIDAGDVRFFDRPLNKKESLNHLGLFFSQLGVGTEALQTMLFQTYVKARGWLVRERDIKRLSSYVAAWQTKRLLDFKKKLSRSSSAFVIHKTISRHTQYDRDEESTLLLHYLHDPDSALNATNTALLKNGRSATVAKITIADKAFVLKRYNMKNSLHWLRRCLRHTRAASTWQRSHLLRLMGIDTPRCIAYTEKRMLGLRSRSWLFMEWIEGQHLGEYLLSCENNSAKMESMARKVVALFDNLAKLNITHGDLKMTNILIKDDKPYLIDLDGMQQHKTSKQTRRALKQDIHRFQQNWVSYPAIAAVFAPLLTALD